MINRIGSFIATMKGIRSDKFLKIRVTMNVLVERSSLKILSIKGIVIFRIPLEVRKEMDGLPISSNFGIFFRESFERGIFFIVIMTGSVSSMYQTIGML
jgi:hypothetical protein